MRGRLWPDADLTQLRREADEYAGHVSSFVAAAFLVEEQDGTPIGFIEISVRPFSEGCESMPVPHVEGWYVEPHARGRGIGRALMKAAEGWSRDRGFAELASDAELEDPASQLAHEALGFEEVDRLVKFRKFLYPQN